MSEPRDGSCKKEGIFCDQGVAPSVRRKTLTCAPRLVPVRPWPCSAG